MHKFPVNRYGYIQYPRNHLGRDINVIKAIITLEHPTAGRIAKQLGLSKTSVIRSIGRLNNETTIRIGSTESEGYILLSWGILFTEKIVQEYDKTIKKVRKL